MSIPPATTIVHGWLDRQNVHAIEPGPRHWERFFAALADANVTGPRVRDAHLAALAIEHGATFYTNDRDFRLFPKLDVRFPLT
jgi:predicted nucleic acid-binding protein